MNKINLDFDPTREINQRGYHLFDEYIHKLNDLNLNFQNIDNNDISIDSRIDFKNSYNLKEKEKILNDIFSLFFSSNFLINDEESTNKEKIFDKFKILQNHANEILLFYKINNEKNSYTVFLTNYLSFIKSCLPKKFEEKEMRIYSSFLKIILDNFTNFDVFVNFNYKEIKNIDCKNFNKEKFIIIIVYDLMFLFQYFLIRFFESTGFVKICFSNINNSYSILTEDLKNILYFQEENYFRLFYQEYNISHLEFDLNIIKNSFFDIPYLNFILFSSLFSENEYTRKLSVNLILIILNKINKKTFSNNQIIWKLIVDFLLDRFNNLNIYLNSNIKQEINNIDLILSRENNKSNKEIFSKIFKNLNNNLLDLINISEINGTGFLKSHGQICSSGFINIYFEYKILEPKNKNYLIKEKFYLNFKKNFTIWEIKIILAEKFNSLPESINLKFNEIFLIINGKSLKDYKIKDNSRIEITTIDNSIKIQEVKLTNIIDNKLNLSVEFEKLLEVLFKKYSTFSIEENKNKVFYLTKENICKYIQDSVNSPYKISTTDIRVNNFFTFEKNSNLQEEKISIIQFKKFYLDILIKNIYIDRIIYNNIKNLGYRVDLRQTNEKYQPLKDKDIFLPRNYIANNLKFFEFISGFSCKNLIDLICTPKFVDDRIIELFYLREINFDNILDENFSEINLFFENKSLYEKYYFLEIIESFSKDFINIHSIIINTTHENIDNEMNNEVKKDIYFNLNLFIGFILKDGFTLINGLLNKIIKNISEIEIADISEFNEVVNIILKLYSNILEIYLNLFEDEYLKNKITLNNYNSCSIISNFEKIFENCLIYKDKTEEIKIGGFYNNINDNIKDIELNKKNKFEKITKLFLQKLNYIKNEILTEENINILTIIKIKLINDKNNNKLNKKIFKNCLDLFYKIISISNFNTIDYIFSKNSNFNNYLQICFIENNSDFDQNMKKLSCEKIKQFLEEKKNNGEDLINSPIIKKEILKEKNLIKKEKEIKFYFYQKIFEFFNYIILKSVDEKNYVNLSDNTIDFLVFLISYFKSSNKDLENQSNKDTLIKEEIKNPSIKKIILEKNILKNLINNYLFSTQDFQDKEINPHNLFENKIENYNNFNNYFFLKKEGIFFDNYTNLLSIKKFLLEIITILINIDTIFFTQLLESNFLKLPKNLNLSDIKNLNFNIRQNSSPCGIKNLGSTCYINSIIQQLYFIYPLRNAILSSDDKTKYKLTEFDDNFLHQIQKLFTFLKYGIKTSYDPRDFCFSFKNSDGSPLNVKLQEDCQEFLARFVDLLENKLKFTENKNIFRDTIGGKFCFILKCNKCKTKFYKNEEFINLSLQVKNEDNLISSLEKYISNEIIEGYLCEKCNNKTNFTRRVLLSELPNVLLINLQRILFDPIIMENVKINSKLTFPLELNMKKFCLETKEKSEYVGNNIIDKDDYYEYNLVGVVVHIGNANAGHYYSIINTSRDAEIIKPSESKWFRFDDSVVMPFNTEDFETECFGKCENKNNEMNNIINKNDLNWVNNKNNINDSELDVGRSAYLLIYERKLKSNIKKIIKNEILNENKNQINMGIDKKNFSLNNSVFNSNEIKDVENINENLKIEKNYKINFINKNSEDLEKYKFKNRNFTHNDLFSFEINNEIFFDKEKNEYFKLIPFYDNESKYRNFYLDLVEKENKQFLEESLIFSEDFFEFFGFFINKTFSYINSQLNEFNSLKNYENNKIVKTIKSIISFSFEIVFRKGEKKICEKIIEEFLKITNENIYFSYYILDYFLDNPKIFLEIIFVNNQENISHLKNILINSILVDLKSHKTKLIEYLKYSPDSTNTDTNLIFNDNLTENSNLNKTHSKKNFNKEKIINNPTKQHLDFIINTNTNNKNKNNFYEDINSTSDLKIINENLMNNFNNPSKAAIVCTNSHESEYIQVNKNEDDKNKKYLNINYCNYHVNSLNPTKEKIDFSDPAHMVDNLTDYSNKLNLIDYQNNNFSSYKKKLNSEFYLLKEDNFTNDFIKNENFELSNFPKSLLIILYLINLLPVKITKYWTKIFSYFDIINSLLKSDNKIILLIFLKNNLILKLVDLFLGIKSPFYNENQERTQICSMVIPKFGILFDIISYMLNTIFSCDEKKFEKKNFTKNSQSTNYITETNKKSLGVNNFLSDEELEINNFQFFTFEENIIFKIDQELINSFTKILKNKIFLQNSLNEYSDIYSISNIFSYIAREDIETSKIILYFIFENFNKKNLNLYNTSNLFELLKGLIKLDDNLTLERLEMIFGIPQINLGFDKGCYNSVPNSKCDRIYKFISPLFNCNKIESLTDQIFFNLVSSKNDFILILCNFINTILLDSPKALEYFYMLPHPKPGNNINNRSIVDYLIELKDKNLINLKEDNLNKNGKLNSDFLIGNKDKNKEFSIVESIENISDKNENLKKEFEQTFQNLLIQLKNIKIEKNFTDFRYYYGNTVNDYIYLIDPNRIRLNNITPENPINKKINSNFTYNFLSEAGLFIFIQELENILKLDLNKLKIERLYSENHNKNTIENYITINKNYYEDLSEEDYLLKDFSKFEIRKKYKRIHKQNLLNNNSIIEKTIRKYLFLNTSNDDYKVKIKFISNTGNFFLNFNKIKRIQIIKI